jgi:nuclear pore complex protein Nup107
MNPSPKPTARSLLRENPYTPTATLAQAIMQSSPLLSELIVIREWLQEIAPNPKQPEASNGYWKMTRLRLEQELRAAGSGGLNTKGMVREMDPDAIGREENKALAADDAVHSHQLCML